MQTSKVMMLLMMMMTDLWGIEPCSVGVDRHLGAMMEAVRTSFETSVNLNETTLNHRKRRRENLKSPKVR
jgi:hypothetical protein